MLEEKLTMVERDFSDLAASSQVMKHLTKVFLQNFKPRLSRNKDDEEGKLLHYNELK